MTKTEGDKVDACHRKHLRRVVGTKWPNKISNDKLYELCGVRPLTERLATLRWGLLGHVLRLDRAAPAQRALDFALGKKVSNMKARRGRHPTNLLSTINNDASQRGERLKNLKDLETMGRVAADKTAWRRISCGLMAREC